MNEIEIIASALHEQGYRYAFGIIGSGISYKLIQALKKKGIEYFPVSNESCAAIAAGAASYLNGDKSICISIKGPGFANLLAGLTACYLERFPVLSFSEDYDSAASLLKQHKRVDQVSMIRPVVSGISSFLQTESFPGFITQAPGNEMPVHFEMAKISETSLKPVQLQQPSKYRKLDSDLLIRIRDSKRPVLIVGSLLHRLHLEKLLEKLELPIFTTAQAKGCFDERRDNACGVYTGVGEKLVHESEIPGQSDCVITLGLRNYEILGTDEKQQFLNFDIPHPEADASTILIEPQQIEELITLLDGKSLWCFDLIDKHRKMISTYVDSYDFMPGHVFKAINQLEGNFTLVLDTGSFCTVGEYVYQASSLRRFIGSSNGRNMGTSVPIALGVSTGGNSTICCCGDGGIRYHLGDVRTLGETGLPICIILMTDGVYGSIACSIPTDNLDMESVQPKGTSWVKVIGAMGIPSHQARMTEDLEKLLKDWDQKGPLFIEASFDSEIYRNITKDLRR